MTKKQEIVRIEKQIMKLSRYIKDHGLFRPLNDWDAETKSQLKDLLSRRCLLMNQMFKCSREDIEAFKLVNERLYELSQKMYAKTLSLYKAILLEGYDPEFDDDIRMEGTLRYVFNHECESVIWSEEERKNRYVIKNGYGSDIAAMLDILYDLYEDGSEPECAFCGVSYSLHHKPDMPASEFDLENIWDDGKSWNEAPLDRPEFKDICICHAVHDFCCHKLYSIPDLLRMNDFWVEVKITHQHLTDREGKRYSMIVSEKED